AQARADLLDRLGQVGFVHRLVIGLSGRILADPLAGAGPPLAIGEHLLPPRPGFVVVHARGGGEGPIFGGLRGEREHLGAPAFARADPLASWWTANRQGTPRPISYSRRTRSPGPLGATSTTSMSARGATSP